MESGVPHTVIELVTTPEVIQIAGVLILTVLALFVWLARWGIKSIRHRIQSLEAVMKTTENTARVAADSASAAHEQVANNHSVNLRDDIDELKSEVGETRSSIGVIMELLAQAGESQKALSDEFDEMRHEQHDRANNQASQLNLLWKDVSAAEEKATQERNVLHRRVSDTKEEQRRNFDELSSKIGMLESSMHRLHPDAE